MEMFTIAGYPAVTWPSGTTTIMAWAGNTATTLLEMKMAIHPSSLRAEKVEQARRQADAFIEKVERTGVWVRQRRNGRKRGRVFASIDWTPPPIKEIRVA